MWPKMPIVKRAVRSTATQFNTKLFDLSRTVNRKSLWNYVSQRHALADATACLNALLPPHLATTQDVVKRALDEVAWHPLLRASIERARRRFGTRVPLPTLEAAPSAWELFCYVLPRLLKPATIIETGCATGWLSALFLLALEQNQHGHLYSIDLPPVAGQLSMEWTMPDEAPIGFLVPAELRSRWSLIQGNARVELIPLLEKVQPVDLFCHDSDHSYVHMMWEFATVWPFLAEQGVLLSDDIGWNTAFWDFATAVDRPMTIYRGNTNVGAFTRAP